MPRSKSLFYQLAVQVNFSGMARRIPTGDRRDPRSFLSPVSSAFFELVLIILLYIHALLSYLVYKFARYCKLPNPCLLCTRLDWRRPCLYKELMCNSHKLEVSSLVYCRTHRKLADAHEMCDVCILHFVGKVGKDIDDGSLGKKFQGEDIMKVPLPKKDLEPGSLSKRHCSCCSALLHNRPPVHRLLQGKHVTEPDASLSGSHIRNGLTKGSDHGSKSISVCHGAENHFQRMSHGGLTSDSKSEVPILYEDDNQSLSRGIGDVKEELLSRCLQAAPSASVPKNLTQVTSAGMFSEKLINLCPVMTDASITERRLQMSDPHSATGIGHGLEVINSSQADLKQHLSASPEVTIERVPSEASITKCK